MRIYPPFPNLNWERTIKGGDALQYFRENKELYRKAIGTDGHTGVDLYRPEGTPIMGTKGTVIDVENRDGLPAYGKHVRILTDYVNGEALLVTYGHCRNVMVKVGDKIEDGQIIAEVSNTGTVMSGGNIYWGNAPANKGVHLHLNVQVCLQTGSKVSVFPSGYAVTIKDWGNGVHGSRDPADYLEASDVMKKQYWTKMVDIIKAIISKLNT